MKLADFKHIDLFAGLSEEALEFELNGRLVTLRRGEPLFQEGDETREFFVVLEGTIRVYRIIKGQELPITDFSEGATGGEVPLLSGTPHLASGKALTDVRLLALGEDDFWALMSRFESIRRKVLANMAERMRDLQLLSAQREKLVSLGTLAAGLAHELNNPAAAARRSSQKLVETLDEFGDHSAGMLKWVVFKTVEGEEDPFEPLVGAMELQGVSLDPLSQSEREDELADWLEELGVPEPWEAAATLVSVGYTRDFLEGFAEAVKPEQIANLPIWLAKDIEMRLLARELAESTTRISDLIGAMKAYSYMDQAVDKSEVDLHAGLDNTLLILKHKLKAKNIQVVKDYSDQVGRICAYGSELNQIWTNLIDNAIYALPEDGVITIKTYPDAKDPGMVTVEISDNGPGIPEELQTKIFDPFFTTKGVGQGIGLGLEIVQRIVVNQHQGTINLDTEPGKTTFKVCLPVNL